LCYWVRCSRRQTGDEVGQKANSSQQAEYAEDFRCAVVAFLDFAACHTDVAERLADTVTKHGTPIVSGTVARTQRIPIERRAESAVIAWLRHETTAYENMKIARVKGKRREVRRMLAEQSRRLLEGRRAGDAVDAEECPLQRSLCDEAGYTGNDASWTP
jgi:hypothetical protein